MAWDQGVGKPHRDSASFFWFTAFMKSRYKRVTLQRVWRGAEGSRDQAAKPQPLLAVNHQNLLRESGTAVPSKKKISGGAGLKLN